MITAAAYAEFLDKLQPAHAPHRVVRVASPFIIPGQVIVAFWIYQHGSPSWRCVPIDHAETMVAMFKREEKQRFMARKYVILTVDDAAYIAQTFFGGAHDGTIHRIRAIIDRLRLDTGAPMQEIAEGLRKLTVCYPCNDEGDEVNCQAHRANAAGLRLAKLLARARGEREPGPGR